MTFDFRGAVSRVFELKGRVEKSDSPGRDDGKLTVKGEIARAGADKLAEEAKKNRDVAQRRQASRENAVSMICDHAIHM